VSRHSIQQELTESSSDLHFLTFTVVGEGVFDDCCVILIDNIGLVVTGGKDNVFADCNMRTDKHRREVIRVVDDYGVYVAERCFCCKLMCRIILFGEDRI